MSASFPAGRPVPSHRRPRITYLITSSGASWGGAERQVQHLARTFASRGWEVGVVTMLATDPSMLALADEGIRVASLGMRRAVPDPRAMLALRTVLRRWRPDVVHSHMVHANLLARLTRLVARIPVLVSTIHNEDEGRQWRYIAYRLTNWLSDRTTAVSEGAVAATVRRGAAAEGEVTCLVNGLPLDAYRRDRSARIGTRRALGLSDQFTWLAVGRLTAAKAYPLLLDAFARALADCPSARLLIAGIGPDEAAIRTRLLEAGLEDSVSVLGLRGDVPALMQAADAFVMSSAWEGLPMVLLEASASSLPIVTTDVGGSREAVLDGSSGLVVPPGDVESLAAAMSRVMTMPAKGRRSMGRAGRAHVASTFDLETVADAWERLYLEALRDR